MKIYDITLSISEALPVWPGDPPLKLTPASNIEQGDEANVSALQMSTHTGTHIDAPRHFIPDGLTVDQLPLNQLIGPCRVVDLLHLKRCIDRSDLESSELSGITRILFKTQNTIQQLCKTKTFQTDYIALTNAAAAYLNDIGIRLIGIDAPSVEAYQNAGHPVHHLLLKNSVIIIEGLDLENVPAGDYQLIALPLKIKDADGAPARVVLRELSA